MRTIGDVIQDFKYNINSLIQQYTQSDTSLTKRSHDYIHHMMSAYHYHIKMIASYSMDYSRVLITYIQELSICYNVSIEDKTILDTIIFQLANIPEYNKGN